MTAGHATESAIRSLCYTHDRVATEGQTAVVVGGGRMGDGVGPGSIWAVNSTRWNAGLDSTTGISTAHTTDARNFNDDAIVYQIRFVAAASVLGTANGFLGEVEVRQRNKWETEATP